MILKQEYPVFGYLPFETMISENQEDYYKALGNSDKSGSSIIFIEYMLELINQALDEYLSFSNRPMKRRDRLEYFKSIGVEVFSRKHYMDIFKDISTSTASRDLQEGVKLGIFQKSGDKRNTIYKLL